MPSVEVLVKIIVHLDAGRHVEADVRIGLHDPLRLVREIREEEEMRERDAEPRMSVEHTEYLIVELLFRRKALVRVLASLIPEVLGIGDVYGRRSPALLEQTEHLRVLRRVEPFGHEPPERRRVHHLEAVADWRFLRLSGLDYASRTPRHRRMGDVGPGIQHRFERHCAMDGATRRTHAAGSRHRGSFHKQHRQST